MKFPTQKATCSHSHATFLLLKLPHLIFSIWFSIFMSIYFCIVLLLIGRLPSLNNLTLGFEYFPSSYHIATPLSSFSLTFPSVTWRNILLFVLGFRSRFVLAHLVHLNTKRLVVHCSRKIRCLQETHHNRCNHKNPTSSWQSATVHLGFFFSMWFLFSS